MIGRRRLLVAAAAALLVVPAVSPVTARAAEAEASESTTSDTGTLETFIAEGTVGTYRAGLNLTVRDHTRIEAAHYYYASSGRDIPLHVAQDGEWITLREPDGARLILRLANADADTPRPLTFYTSTGLSGDWTRGTTSLPVRFGFGTVRSGPSPSRWYADVTPQPDALFEAKCRQFLEGVIRGDRARAAAAVSWPLQVNGARRLTLRNRAQLLAHWPRLFTPAAIARLRDAIPHEMFVRNGMAMVANGTVWFDAGGAKALNLP